MSVREPDRETHSSVSRGSAQLTSLTAASFSIAGPSVEDVLIYCAGMSMTGRRSVSTAASSDRGSAESPTRRISRWSCFVAKFFPSLARFWSASTKAVRKVSRIFDEAPPRWSVWYSNGFSASVRVVLMHAARTLMHPLEGRTASAYLIAASPQRDEDEVGFLHVVYGTVLQSRPVDSVRNCDTWVA